MLELAIERLARRPLRILCLGAHCDDIDIGCGATLLRLLAGGRRTEVTWIVFSATGERERELRASARRFLRNAAHARVLTYDFRDSFFPGQYVAIKEVFREVGPSLDPDVIFTHDGTDLHQDHRVVSELTWNTFRNHLILEYEVPKFDGGLQPPNAYVRLDTKLVNSKVRILMSAYRSQLAKPWFTAETFRGLMRLRGIEAASPAGWAEGFHARKLCVG